jgi:hypothetical protein
MLVSQEFPSRFLSGDEINGHVVPVTIKEVKKETVKENPKDPQSKDVPVFIVYFEGKERGVKLNKTRANEIKSVTGADDTDHWVGQKVFLYTKPQRAFGELYNVIHIRGSQEDTGYTGNGEGEYISAD